MADDEAGTLANLKHQLDIETDNSNGKLMQYLVDGRLFLDDQVSTAQLSAITNPSKREQQLIEDYAAGKYILKNTQGHSDKPFQVAKNDIKIYIRSKLQVHTDDDIAVGDQQWQKTTGNVRQGRGLGNI